MHVAKPLAGELRRSLLACGVTDQLKRVVLWGTPEVHSSEIPLLEEAVGCSVQLINPFDLVEVGRKVELPEHVGRLAPLLGLMLADEDAPERLIDFLNPRNPKSKQLVPIGNSYWSESRLLLVSRSLLLSTKKSPPLICKLRNSLRRTQLCKTT